MDSAEVTVCIPSVYFPMPLRCHSQVDLLEKRGVAWMEHYGFCASPALRDRIVGTKSGHFYSYLCPEADVDLLQMAVDWAYLMFYFDDFFCDEDSAATPFAISDIGLRLVRMLETADAGVLDVRHPLYAPMLDLSQRLHRESTPVRRQRLVEAHRSWLSGGVWHLGALEHHTVASVNDYIFTRMLHAAGYPTLAWFQIAEKDEISDVEIDAPAVLALTEMAATIAALDDDLYSYGKETWFSLRKNKLLLEENPMSNIVTVYMATNSVNEESAIFETVKLRDQILVRFLEVRDKVLDAASKQLERYLFNLTCLIRGNFEYGLSADRYRNPDGMHPGAVRTVATFSDTPMSTSQPDIASVAWWWDELS